MIYRVVVLLFIYPFVICYIKFVTLMLWLVISFLILDKCDLSMSSFLQINKLLAKIYYS